MSFQKFEDYIHIDGYPYPTASSLMYYETREIEIECERIVGMLIDLTSSVKFGVRTIGSNDYFEEVQKIYHLNKLKKLYTDVLTKRKQHVVLANGKISFVNKKL